MYNYLELQMQLQMQLVQSGTTILVATAAATAAALIPAVVTPFGQGYAVAKAVESIARQPEAQSGISSSLLLGLTLIETGGIYGLMVALLLIFVNPFFNAFVGFVANMGHY